MLDTPRKVVGTLAHEMAHQVQLTMRLNHPQEYDDAHGLWFHAELIAVEQVLASAVHSSNSAVHESKLSCRTPALL
jgi:hypothetical protein